MGASPKFVFDRVRKSQRFGELVPGKSRDHRSLPGFHAPQFGLPRPRSGKSGSGRS